MQDKQKKDVILIGAGIMSATLGTLLNKLEPDWNIKLFEKLDQAGNESSNEWNNAGTGHAALCELNYTVEQPDGSIATDKAVEIYEQFQLSKQFWAYLVEENDIQDPQSFIRPLPHISFVYGEKHVEFLRKRYHALSTFPMFETMTYTEDANQLAEWMPLIMDGRTSKEPVAGTKVDAGTDVNFGELTRKMVSNLEKQDNISIQYQSTVTDIKRMEDGTWEVSVRNLKEGTIECHTADFVFIGAGGGAIPLLQKTKIPESKHIGGFPISGEFLVCKNPDIVNRHEAKVYGKEPDGTPPMTVPHLDRRYLEGKSTLLFGPFAGIGPKFLKKGSNMDFIKSIKPDNTLTLLAAAAKNTSLIKYSIEEVLASKAKRMEKLRTFVPDAKDEDWELVVAGKRVQVIRDIDGSGRGIIQFGTEIVHSEDHSIVALLGESPGASTSVAIMLDVLKYNFSQHIDGWQPKLKEMIPSFGESLVEDVELLKEVDRSSSKSLNL
jgi:malate dehydrogenase (quinone)